jgi:hypothetical protein
LEKNPIGSEVQPINPLNKKSEVQPINPLNEKSEIKPYVQLMTAHCSSSSTTTTDLDFARN